MKHEIINNNISYIWIITAVFYRNDRYTDKRKKKLFNVYRMIIL